MTPCKTAALLALLPKTPLYQQLIAMEATSGWPWSSRGVDGSFCITVPFFSAPAQRADHPAPIYPPSALITVRWQSGQPVQYSDLTFSNPWPEARWTEPCGVFPHKALEGLSAAAYTALRVETHRLYDGLFERLDARQAVPPDISAALRERLERLVPPGHVPFYRKLAPRFFERLLPPA